MAIQEIFNAVTEFKKDKVTELVMTEIDSGTEISIILNDGLIAPLDEVGKQFSDGKLFVPEMLRAAHAMKAGLEVLRPFLEDAEDSSADIVAMSALLTTSMPAMEATVAAIKDNGLQVKTMVGGAPLNREFADRIGADGYSDDAPRAVSIARKFMVLGSPIKG